MRPGTFRRFTVNYTQYTHEWQVFSRSWRHSTCVKNVGVTYHNIIICSNYDPNPLVNLYVYHKCKTKVEFNKINRSILLLRKRKNGCQLSNNVLPLNIRGIIDWQCQSQRLVIHDRWHVYTFQVRMIYMYRYVQFTRIKNEMGCLMVIVTTVEHVCFMPNKVLPTETSIDNFNYGRSTRYQKKRERTQQLRSRFYSFV